MLGLTAPEASDQPANPRAAVPALPNRLGERHDAPAERSGFKGESAKTQATVVATPASMACTACATIAPAVAPNALTWASKFSSPRLNTAASPTPTSCLTPALTSRPSRSRSPSPASPTARWTASAANAVDDRP